MNRKIELPGVLWVALLVGLPAVIALIGQEYGGEKWAALAMGILGIILSIAKGIQVFGATGQLPTGERPQYEAAPAAPRGRWFRLALG
jgi:hypothetical protein